MDLLAGNRVRGAFAGTRVVGAALAVSGVCSYVFLATASRSLSPGEYSRLAAAWTVLFIAEPAFFAPVAHVMARNIASGRVRDDRANLVSGAVAGTTILFAVGALAVLLREPVRDDLFDGDAAMYAVVLAALPCQLALTLAWGFSTGRSRYRTYAKLLATDALARLAVAIVLGLRSSAPSPAGFAIPFIVGPILAVWVSRHALRPPEGRTFATSEQLAAGRAVFHQMLSSSIGIAMLSFGPIAVKLLASPAEAGEAGRLQNALTISQAPLLILNATLVVLLPALSRMVANGDHRQCVRVMRSALGLHIAVSALVVAVGAWAGPFVVRVAYGSRYDIASADFALLVAAAACFFGAQLSTQGLLALRCERSNIGAYVVGAIAMVSTFVSTDGLLRRVELAFLAGTVTSYVACTGLLALQLHRRSSVDEVRAPRLNFDAASAG